MSRLYQEKEVKGDMNPEHLTKWLTAMLTRMVKRGSNSLFLFFKLFSLTELGLWYKIFWSLLGTTIALGVGNRGKNGGFAYEIKSLQLAMDGVR